MPRQQFDFFRNFDKIFGQIFDQVFGQVLDQVFGQGLGEGKPRKYSVQYYWDGKIQCTVLPGQGKILFTIYYSKSKKSKNSF